jgi:hypothetical protein
VPDNLPARRGSVPAKVGRPPDVPNDHIPIIIDAVLAPGEGERFDRDVAGTMLGQVVPVSPSSGGGGPYPAQITHAVEQGRNVAVRFAIWMPPTHPGRWGMTLDGVDQIIRGSNRRLVSFEVSPDSINRGVAQQYANFYGSGAPGEEPPSSSGDGVTYLTRPVREIDSRRDARASDRGRRRGRDARPGQIDYTPFDDERDEIDEAEERLAIARENLRQARLRSRMVSAESRGEEVSFDEVDEILRDTNAPYRRQTIDPDTILPSRTIHDGEDTSMFE